MQMSLLGQDMSTAICTCMLHTHASFPAKAHFINHAAQASLGVAKEATCILVLMVSAGWVSIAADTPAAMPAATNVTPAGALAKVEVVRR